MAMSIFAIHLFGDMISPPLVGAMSDAWTLRAGMFVLPAALVIAAFAWLRGSREWVASPVRA
jgi:Na+/melibiose symporter-like transporter